MGPLSLIAALAGAAAIAFALMQLLKYFDQLDKDSSTALMLQLDDPNSLKPLSCPSIWGPATKQLSIVIPAYNEEDRLPGSLDETLGYLQRRRNKQGPAFTYEIIIVDDGSKDSTAAVALGYVKTHGIDAVRLLRLPHNCGKGRAVREGMLIARGQSCLFMDADGATRVSDMELLEAALQEVASSKDSTVSNDSKAANGKAAAGAVNATVSKVGSSAGFLAAAVGSRAHLEQEALAKRHWLRNFLMHGFHMLVVFVAGGAVKDTQCGFKMFSRHAAALLYTNQRLQRWCFDVELLYLCSRLRVPVKEVQVRRLNACAALRGLLQTLHTLVLCTHSHVCTTSSRSLKARLQASEGLSHLGMHQQERDPQFMLACLLAALWCHYQPASTVCAVLVADYCCCCAAAAVACLLQVKWVEMPGSKIRASSIVHMAFELAVIKLAYQWLRVWQVKTEADDKGASKAHRLKAA